METTNTTTRFYSMRWMIVVLIIELKRTDVLQMQLNLTDDLPSFIHTWLTHSCFFCIPLVEKLSIGMSWEVER